MNKFLTLTAEQRRAVFERVGVNVGLPMQAVEKDFWVTIVLQTIFSLPIAQHLIFKGGTSLSKAWGLINRFSEDIDLAVGIHHSALTWTKLIEQLTTLQDSVRKTQ
jgi:predicted nucleotidyltransferase component of viral defense system